jgi:alpha-L-rhamnosidase
MLELIEKRQEFAGMILPENPHSPYNDWLNPTGENLSKVFFSGCWYLRMLDIVSRVADVLGDTAKRDELRERFAIGCREFNRRHYDFEAAEYDEKIQSALVLPLAFDLLPIEERQRAGDTLNRYVAENGYSLTTGFHATRYLPEVLTQTGHLDTAVKLFHRTAFPSWNDMLATGATNVTESWLGMRDPDLSISMSHFSLGAVVSYFFEYLGGIAVEECAPGFSRVVFKPHFHPAIGDCCVRYQTPHGEIVSEWHYENGEPVWSYQVPDGVTVKIL